VSGNILIIHPLFEILGGGELLALKTSQALRESGFKVDVLTCMSIDLNLLKRLFGDIELPRIIIKRVKINNYISKFTHGRAVRLRRILIYRSLIPLINEYMEKYDLVIETQSNLPMPVDISYIHYPALVHFTVNAKKGLQWRIYNKLVELTAKPFKTPRTSKILTNSTWTAHMIYKTHRVIADVVYPPVDIEYFNNFTHNEKDKIIVTTSRFTPEKNLEKILDIAHSLLNYKFIITGSTGPGSERVLNTLERKIEKLKLNNVEIKPNIPRHELGKILSTAKYYLHPPFPEHFGISIIEAMAAGCIPIVYRDGGAWYDVVSKISSILGYSDIGEIPVIIKKLEENRELYIKLKERSIEVSGEFNYENFKKKLLEKINYVLKVKHLDK